MIKFFKNTGKGGNGEFIIQTDAKTLDEFTNNFADALAVFSADNDDLNHAMSFLIPHAIQLSFKLAGYKTDLVHESRVLTCGYSSPADCNLVHEA